MQQYRFAHCLALLGLLVNGEPVPACPEHPDGAVELIAGDDDDQ
jgi:hypothetical protein